MDQLEARAFRMDNIENKKREKNEVRKLKRAAQVWLEWLLVGLQQGVSWLYFLMRSR